MPFIQWCCERVAKSHVAKEIKYQEEDEEAVTKKAIKEFEIFVS